MNAQPAAGPHPAAALPAHLRRLVLTGFMGAGKTTIGRLLAARLNWDFLDLDAYIESRAGLSVPSIFSTHGERRFRQLESAALASALGRNRLVLALGGGAPRSSPTASSWSRPPPHPPSSSTRPSPPSSTDA